VRPGRGPDLERGCSDQPLVEEDLRAGGIRRHRDQGRCLGLRGLQRDADGESLAGLQRHLLRHRLVSVAGNLQLVLARFDFRGEGRLAELLAVDANRRWRLGLHAQACGAGALQREGEVGVAVGMDLDRPLLLDESGPRDRHAVRARIRFRGPGRDADLCPVHGHGSAGWRGGDREARPAPVAGGQVEPDGQIAIFRHVEVGAHVASAFVAQHQLVVSLGQRHDQRRAATLLVVDEHDGADRVRLDRESGRLRQRRQRERQARVTPLAAEERSLLPQPALHLDCHGVLAGRQRALIRGASDEGAVDQDVRLGRLTVHRQRRGAPRLARQVHREIHPAALDLDLLLRAPPVGTCDGQCMAPRHQPDAQRRGASVLVVDANGGARLLRANGHRDRLGRGIEGDARDRLPRRSDARGPSFVVLRLDEVFEGPVGEDARGEPRFETPLGAAIAHRERFVALVSRSACEHQGRKQPRGVLHLRLDHDRRATRRLLDRRVRDLPVAPRLGWRVGFCPDRFFVHCEQGALTPIGDRTRVGGRGSGEQSDGEQHRLPHQPDAVGLT